MITEPIRANTPRLTERIEEMRQEIIRLRNIKVGAGLVLLNTPGGIGFALKEVAEAVSVPAQDNTGGTATVLTQTQGTQDTDDWVRDDDKTPVELQVYTDLQYDTTTHKISARLRTLKFDKGGNLTDITGEGNLVDITTAVACPLSE